MWEPRRGVHSGGSGLRVSVLMTFRSHGRSCSRPEPPAVSPERSSRKSLLLLPVSSVLVRPRPLPQSGAAATPRRVSQAQSQPFPRQKEPHALCTLPATSISSRRIPVSPGLRVWSGERRAGPPKVTRGKHTPGKTKDTRSQTGSRIRVVAFYLCHCHHTYALPCSLPCFPLLVIFLGAKKSVSFIRFHI